MRYASERLSLFRTVFVQVAALLLFAAGGMLLAVAERELNVRPTHHVEMAPAAELLDKPAARCTQRPAGRAPSACREIVSEEDPRFSAALCPERTFPPCFSRNVLSGSVKPSRPSSPLGAASSPFPCLPPRPPSGPGTAFRLLLGAVPSTRLVFPCRFRSGCTVPPDGLFRKASVSRRSSLRLRLAAWRKNAVRPGCPASTL